MTRIFTILFSTFSLAGSTSFAHVPPLFSAYLHISLGLLVKKKTLSIVHDSVSVLLSIMISKARLQASRSNTMSFSSINLLQS
ncbi:hypothetical protein DFH29DRAFT_324259 [Suillus ampliporus]|nr:hypothetical protein DFH29DRAFT_324259 [Suillus ampliporus]